jgi:Iron-containing redox enzyme
MQHADADPEQLHRELAKFNHARMTPVHDEPDWLTSLQAEYRMRRIEHEYIERDALAIRSWAREAPLDPQQFVAWFEALEQHGPGQGDALFPWLAEDASLEELRWFLRQEMAGEAGFDDLVAMTQVKLPVRAKLEMARNYWDEMGQGNASGMHGPMLERLGKALELAQPGDDIVWESLALSNLMVALATNRRYAYQSIGALGVIELTAPGRAAQVNRGLKRLGIQGDARRYYALHATLDVKHSNAWNREILAPLVAENPKVPSLIAEGALLRLTAGKRCFERYRRELLRPAPAPVLALPLHRPAVQVAYSS